MSPEKTGEFEPDAALQRTDQISDPLRTRRFTALVCGWTLANVADSLLTIILAVWVVDLTGNAAWGGVALAVMGLPACAAPFLGHLIDRYSRRKCLVVAYLIGAFSLLPLFAVTSGTQIWVVFVAATVYSCLSYVTGSCQSGILKDTLPEEHLGRANGVLSSIDQTLRMTMPFVGAGAYTLFGMVPMIAVSVATFLCAAIVFALVRLPEATVVVKDGSLVASLLAGFRHLFSSPPLPVLSWSILVSMAALGVVNGVVFAAFQHLGIPAAWAGPLMVGQGVGGVIAGFLVARLMDRFGRVVVYGVGMCILGFGLVPFVTGPVVLLAVSQLVVGFSASLAVVAFVTECQVSTPNHLQGRVAAAGQVIRNFPSAIVAMSAAAATTWVDYRLLLGGTIVVLLAAGIVPVCLTRKHTSEPSRSA